MIQREFIAIAADIITRDEYRQLREYKHHVRGTVYSHSVKVAYLCYRHLRRRGRQADARELVRGALLHDLYLYERRRFGLRHWVIHPRYALKNAKALCPDLTPRESDIIRRHMFPLTPIPPKYKESWLVCYFDKVAAVSDFFRKRRERRT